MTSVQMREIIDALRRRQAERASGPPRTLAQTRAAFAPVGQLLPLPDDVTVTAVDAGGVTSYWLDPPATEPGQVLLYLHGGGYTLGSLSSHGPLAAELGRATGRRVLFPHYRLAPEHQFPSAVEDVHAVWQWLRTVHGTPAASVVVAGDSAGGGLALTLLQQIRDAGETLPARGVLLSPLLDLTASGDSLTRPTGDDPIFTPQAIRALAPVYLGDADPRDPAASPLFGTLAGLPPLLVQTGTAEVLLSDSQRLAHAAAEAGVDIILQTADRLPHVYQGALGTPEAVQAVRLVAEFTRGQ